MEISIQPRQTGKTTQILWQMKQDKGAIMIVPNQHFKKDLKRKHELEGRVFTFREFISGALAGRHYSKIYIDELGCCLESVFTKIEYATHTNNG